MSAPPEEPPREPLAIERARPSRAALLSEIAHAAKRHWGYPETWIAAWRDELTLTEDFVRANDVFAARRGEAVVGFYALACAGARASLEHLWVRPEHIGSGAGRLLFEHAARRARAAGAERLEIVSDPNAAGFYARMGAVHDGDELTAVEGRPRRLPIYVLRLDGTPG